MKDVAKIPQMTIQNVYLVENPHKIHFGNN